MSFVHDSFTNISNTNIRNIVSSASELLENIEEIFLGTRWAVMLSPESDIQTHTVLPVAKGLIKCRCEIQYAVTFTDLYIHM